MNDTIINQQRPENTRELDRLLSYRHIDSFNYESVHSLFDHPAGIDYSVILSPSSDESNKYDVWRDQTLPQRFIELICALLGRIQLSSSPDHATKQAHATHIQRL